jgi:hypothetical protein
MDYNEFEIPESSVNPDKKYNDEIEFVIKQLNYIAHVAGRYDRSVQIPIAKHIVNKLAENRTKQNEKL